MLFSQLSSFIPAAVAPQVSEVLCLALSLSLSPSDEEAFLQHRKGTSLLWSSRAQLYVPLR